MAFVKAWSVATGREQLVPEHFFNNAKLSDGLTREPPTGEPVQEEAVDNDPPTEKWTNERIEDYARTHSIDLGDATKKSDMLAAIQKVQSEPENPALDAIGVAHPGPGGETASQDVSASDQVTTPTPPSTGMTQE